MHFLVNTVQKRVTQCRKVKHECKLKRRYPKLKRRLPEANRCISKTAEDRAKPSEDRTKPSEDYRRPHETFRRFPKIARTFSECFRRSPEYFRRLPEDCPNTSEDLRQSSAISEDHRIFSKLFQVLEDRTQYLLCTSVVNVWSEASVLLISNHMIFLVQFGINKHLQIFLKTTNCTRPTGSCNFVSLSKNLLVLIYSKLHSKPCDYLYKY